MGFHRRLLSYNRVMRPTRICGNAMLSGRQIEQLQTALLDAFASRDALRMRTRIELEQNLDAIAGGDNLRVLVFNLISWAEQTGAVAQLIDGACRQNAGNAKLRDVQRAMHGWGITIAPATAGFAKPTAPRATVDIFLSYSRLDRTAMRIVYDILRKAGFSVWIDEGLEPGTPSWIEAIEEALEQAQAMVVLLSPHAKASTWVRREISYAQGQGRHVFPLLIDGEQATAVPLNLSETHWIDGRRDVQRATQRPFPDGQRQKEGRPGQYRSYKPDESLDGDERRTVRGGSFNGDNRFVRCACRSYFVFPFNDVGLRVVSPGS